MDPASILEEATLIYQKPISEVIERGDSAVQLFYRDATVFVTGGTGFIGKQLIEKLFRSCAIKKMYLLMRSKKGKSMQERLEYLLKDPVFDLLRSKKPQFANQIEPVEGDVAEIRFGICDMIWTKLTEEVNVIFHVAATIKFDEPLRIATLTNVRGTREALGLAKQCSNMKSFVYISTAYSNATKDRVGQAVMEKIYPSPLPPATLIQLAEEIDESRLNNITIGLIDGWPNTYAFTKSVAEEMVRQYGDLPVCVVRPSIVTAAFAEPSPGWLSGLAGATGMIMGIFLGVVHVFRVNKHVGLAMAPVDFVNNAVIAAGWDTAQTRRSVDVVPVYTVCDMDCGFTWYKINRTMFEEIKCLISPKAMWMCGTIETTSKLLYKVLSLFLHYLPAYFLDFFCKKPKGIKSFVGVYKNVDKFGALYYYFISQWWAIKNDNLNAMIGRMSEADKIIFNCDFKTINLKEYIKIWGIGIRKYIIKDELRGTAEAYRKQKIYTIANYLLMVLYGYVLWFIFCVILKLFLYICGL